MTHASSRIPGNASLLLGCSFLFNEKFSADFQGKLGMGRQGEKVNLPIPKRAPKNARITHAHTHSHTGTPTFPSLSPQPTMELWSRRASPRNACFY